MDIYDEAWWIIFIGLIPEDFLVRVKSKKVCLYYKGEDHETFAQPSKAEQLLERNACLIFFVSITPPYPEIQHSIHSAILGAKQTIWENRLAQFPDGFSIKISRSPQGWKGFPEQTHSTKGYDFQLSLRYDGPGYKELIEPGGKKPPKGQSHAFLCMHAIPYKQEEVVSYILENVERAQKELSVLSK